MNQEPILCVFRDGGLFPRGAAATARLNDEAGEGEIVTVTLEHQRSDRTHNHQFAEISEMWRTLPEWLADKPFAASADALRKHALIKTGYTNVETIVTDSAASAERVAAYVGNLARQAHGYCIVSTDKRVVMVATPHSQSRKAMGAKRFQESKTAVLGWIGALLAGGRP